MAREWRQGDILTLSAAKELDQAADEKCRYIVCSHSCDLQEMQGIQLVVAKGECVDEVQGNFVGAKSIKILQLRTASGKIVNYAIESLQVIDVAILDRHSPWVEEAHDIHEKNVLALWLSQRFDRLALPDDVALALKASGVEAALQDVLKKAAHEILDVRVRFDESVSPPSLAFLIIYDAGEEKGPEVAKGVATTVMNRVDRKAQELDGKVTVSGAYPIADTALTYSQHRNTRPYRVEYISLRTQPPAVRPVK